MFTSRKGDLVIWQMSNTIQSVEYSDDFEADVLLASPGFLSLTQQHARTEREVAFYADKLCITPKYLSQVARTITNLPASQWIQFYAAFELVSLLNDIFDIIYLFPEKKKK